MSESFHWIADETVHVHLEMKASPDSTVGQDWVKTNYINFTARDSYTIKDVIGIGFQSVVPVVWLSSTVILESYSGKRNPIFGIKTGWILI